MKSDVCVRFCVMLALIGPSLQQAGGQSHAPAPAPAVTSSTLPGHTDTSASPDVTDDPRSDLPQPTRNPAGVTETAGPTTAPQTDAAAHTEVSTHSGLQTQPFTSLPTTAAHQPTAVANGTAFPSTAADRPGSRVSPPPQTSTTEGRVSSQPLATFSSQTANTTQDAVSTATQPRPEPTSTATRTDSSRPQTPPASVQAPAVPTHRDLPSELNVGDEDLKGSRHHSSSPLDPLLAALLSVFIVTTAIIFIILFLKFRQRTNHPEFHRLQDLPMDDLMEDTPLSRYTY
ncbi:mucin-2-like [Cololabis saira]|uniref:mucin-2-like n=1 Tax=Cololabis saira TaxID=129043 RepID=UPI002AD583C4|nr:mucin-2-like [Cololabis saira]